MRALLLLAASASAACEFEEVDAATLTQAEFEALALAQGGRVRREKRIKCDGCGALLLDGEAFQKHCAEVDHDDEFAFTCTEVVVEVK